MTSTANVDAALERLRYSAQNTPLPLLDVAGVEKRVLSEVARSDTSSAFIAVRRRSWPTWAVVGIAAAISLFIATQKVRTRAVATTNLPDRGQLAQQEGLDGSALALQQQIVATDHDVTVKHAKLATWRLLAPGKARIVQNGADHVTIALEMGLIQADVIPQPKPESFAIEVEHTRVAVHGTIFSVERHGDLAEVVVREGKVMVSRSDPAGTQPRTLLTAPARAKLDVGPAHELNSEEASLPHLKSQQTPLAVGLHPTNDTKPPNAKEQAALALEQPSIEDLERAWVDVANVVTTCFAEHTARNPSVRVSFKTQLSLNIGANGAIAQVDFNPPVPDPVRNCTLERVTQITTSPSLKGAVLSHPTVLSR